MWQRIQTVFLLIAIIALITTIFLPIWGYQEPSGTTHELYPLHYTITQDAASREVRSTAYLPYSITAILAIAAATIAIIEIRKYKNRMVQMKLGALNSLFMAGAIASAVIFSNGFFKTFQGGSYGLGLWLPGVAVVCNLLANFFIRKDEKLVRDSGRLR
jgi:Na+-transporting NADH:ubiquinone oxidoreductase subunit NqrE